MPAHLTTWTRRESMKLLARAGLLLGVILIPEWPDALAQDASPAAGAGDVSLATTTSTADSGLLDALAPLFQERTGYTLKPIAVGSGAAPELGERGEADVLLDHSPAAEETFMASGFGAERRTVMFNDFIIVGPADDPAGAARAFRPEASQPSCGNLIPGTVSAVTHLPSGTRLVLSTPAPIVACSPWEPSGERWSIGDRAIVAFPADAAHAIPDADRG